MDDVISFEYLIYGIRHLHLIHFSFLTALCVSVLEYFCCFSASCLSTAVFSLVSFYTIYLVGICPHLYSLSDFMGDTYNIKILHLYEIQSLIFCKYINDFNGFF